MKKKFNSLEEEIHHELSKYSVKTEEIKNEKGWSYLNVSVFLDGEQIGEYIRNYPSLSDTFYPFKKDGKGYALYSKHYTATGVMKLPSCEEVCSEELISSGFCPVEYYVPYDLEEGLVGQIGFVAGCVWGDDSSWKIQVLDLSNIENGVILRDDRFRYIELPQEVKLKNAISTWHYDKEDDIIEIGATKKFKLWSGKEIKS